MSAECRGNVLQKNANVELKSGKEGRAAYKVRIFRYGR